jgi:uncharacterized FlaG/YvyC family protein
MNENTKEIIESKTVKKQTAKQKKLQKVIQKIKQNKKDLKVSFTFKFDSDLSEIINTTSKESGISKTELVEEILKDYLM